MLELLDSQDALETEWTREIAHIVMKHPTEVHKREVTAKTVSILLMVALAAAGTAISVNNPMTYTSGNMTYSQYYIFYPNPVWVGGVIQAQPGALVFNYKPHEHQFADRLALRYLYDAKREPSRILRRMRSAGDGRLSEMTAFLQSFGPESVTADSIHGASPVSALLDMGLQTYETTGDNGQQSRPVLYSALSAKREPAGQVNFEVTGTNDAFLKYLEERKQSAMETQTAQYNTKLSALREKRGSGNEKESLAALNEAFAAALAGNREIETARATAETEFRKAAQAAAKTVAKKAGVKVIYIVDKVNLGAPGATDLTSQFQQEFHFLDKYR